MFNKWRGRWQDYWRDRGLTQAQADREEREDRARMDEVYEAQERGEWDPRHLTGLGHRVVRMPDPYQTGIFGSTPATPGQPPPTIIYTDPHQPHSVGDLWIGDDGQTFVQTNNGAVQMQYMGNPPSTYPYPERWFTRISLPMELVEDMPRGHRDQDILVHLTEVYGEAVLQLIAELPAREFIVRLRPHSRCYEVEIATSSRERRDQLRLMMQVGGNRGEVVGSSPTVPTQTATVPAQSERRLNLSHRERKEHEPYSQHQSDQDPVDNRAARRRKRIKQQARD